MRREQRKPRSVKGIGFPGRQKRRCSPMFQGPVTSSRNCCRRACNIFPVCRPGSGWRRSGIDKGFMTAVHAYTNDQPSHDQFPQGPVSRAGGGTLLDPDLDLGAQGGRPGSAGTRRQARRRGHPRAHAERVGSRSQIRGQARDLEGRDQRRREARPSSSLRASSATPTGPMSRLISVTTRDPNRMIDTAMAKGKLI
jgi:hypothetical protein